MNAPVLPRLLIVEDDDVDFRGVQRALKRASLTLTVDRAKNGEEALDRLRAQAPVPQQGVIVLLDLRMPVMSGHDFLEVIRGDPQLSQLIVFVMTTSDDRRDVSKAFEQHVAGYFLKQRLADYSDLMQLLQRYIHLSVVPPLGATP